MMNKTKYKMKYTVHNVQWVVDTIVPLKIIFQKNDLSIVCDWDVKQPKKIVEKGKVIIIKKCMDGV